jgi:hypothetical protein
VISLSRSSLRVWGCFIALTLRVPAAGQAAAEAALGAAASSIGSAGARGINKSIGGVFRKLDEVSQSPSEADAPKTGSAATGAATNAPARNRRSTKSPAVRQEPSATTPSAAGCEDAVQIEKGLAYAELLRRFGPPAMQIASGEAQTMSYLSNGAVVQLELRDGKVVSVSKPGPRRTTGM